MHYKCDKGAGARWLSGAGAYVTASQYTVKKEADRTASRRYTSVNKSIEEPHCRILPVYHATAPRLLSSIVCHHAVHYEATVQVLMGQHWVCEV